MVSQTLETFGKRGKRIRVAKIALSCDEADWQDRALQLAFEIRASFADLEAQRQNIDAQVTVQPNGSLKNAETVRHK